MSTNQFVIFSCYDIQITANFRMPQNKAVGGGVRGGRGAPAGGSGGAPPRTHTYTHTSHKMPCCNRHTRTHAQLLSSRCTKRPAIQTSLQQCTANAISAKHAGCVAGRWTARCPQLSSSHTQTYAVYGVPHDLYAVLSTNSTDVRRQARRHAGRHRNWHWLFAIRQTDRRTGKKVGAPAG